MKAREFKCKIVNNKYLTPTVFEVSFEPNESLEFQPGQFLSVVIPGAGPKGRNLRRAYSIASAPEAKPIELCIKKVEGPGTDYLASLKPGDEISVYAPYGTFIYYPKPSKHLCFIATGTGVAPFRSMILSNQYQEQPPLSAYCLFGTSYENEILYEDEFKKHLGNHWVPCISRSDDSWNGFKGRVTEYLKNFTALPWIETEFYLCGAGDMIKEVKSMLQEHGLDKHSIHYEKYY